jgi:uncharacterized protein (UPF0262 family)
VSEGGKIQNIFFDERSTICRSPQAEHERRIATFDLLEENNFELLGGFGGPYDLHLSIAESRLIFNVQNPLTKDSCKFSLHSSSLRRVVKDYFLICESYFEAIKFRTPSQIETIDMGRRGIHDEGAEILQDRMSGWVLTDRLTARRLFTLICVLHIRG